MAEHFFIFTGSGVIHGPVNMTDRDGDVVNMATWYGEMYYRMASDFAAVLWNRAGIKITPAGLIHEYCECNEPPNVFEEGFIREGKENREHILRMKSHFRRKVLDFAFPARTCKSDLDREMEAWKPNLFDGGAGMKYTITYAAMGGLTIEADSEEAARAGFENRLDEAMDELRRNSIEITGVFAEED